MCCVERAFSVLHPKWLVVHWPSLRLLCFCSVDQSSAGRVADGKPSSMPSCPLFCFLQTGIGVFSPHNFFRVLFQVFVSDAYTMLCPTILLCLVHWIKNDKAALTTEQAQRCWEFVCDTSLWAKKICAKNSIKLRLIVWDHQPHDLCGWVYYGYVCDRLWNCFVDKWTLTLVTGHWLYKS